jgi:hypothetical protein
LVQVSSKRPVCANACGIETLECPTFILQAFRTVTGALFFLTAEPHTPNLKALLQRIYVLYSDYVMKNPFHQLDMPIRTYSGEYICPLIHQFTPVCVSV